jgi:hypothetical protein
MPASYFIDVVRRIVFSRSWGVFTEAEVNSHNYALLHDSRLDPGFGRLADFREVTDFRLSGALVREAADLVSYAPRARRAFIVSNDLAYGLSRMFQRGADVSDEDFTVVRDLPSGMEWVGLDRSTPWPSDQPHFQAGNP